MSIKVSLFIFLISIIHTQTKQDTYTSVSGWIKNGEKNQIVSALNHPIDFTFAPKGQSSLLVLAVNHKQYDVVKLFVKKGANLNSMEGGFQGTAIMYAAYNDDIKMVDLLVKLGANVNQRDGSYGDPAINWAAYSGHTNMVAHLLKIGASPYHVGHGNALDIAFRRGFDEMIKILSDHMNESLELNGNRDRIYNAILNHDLNTAKSILNKGLNPNSHGKYNRPLLHVAANLGHSEMVSLLIQNGADVNRVDRIGFTALYYAGLKNKSEVVTVLLQNGANVNHVSNNRSLNLTPSHLAAIGGSSSSIDILAEFGADMNRVGSTGATPLMWGLFENKKDNLGFIESMINLGADPTIPIPSGYSALDYVKGIKHEKLILIIENYIKEKSKSE